MRKKRFIFCTSLNTKRYGTRSKKRNTSFGKRNRYYQRGTVMIENEPLSLTRIIRLISLYKLEPASCTMILKQATEQSADN